MKREKFGPVAFLWEGVASDVTKSCQRGHFIMVRIGEAVERIALTVADFIGQSLITYPNLKLAQGG